MHITSDKIDEALFRRRHAVASHCGGYASFAGIVRNHNHKRPVRKLVYEAYDVLAEKEMERILTEAKGRFQLGHAQALHRTGSLEIGDVAVVVDASSDHRAEALAAVSYIIDEIKKRVPIWKKEYYDDGTHVWTRCQHSHAQEVRDEPTNG